MEGGRQLATLCDASSPLLARHDLHRTQLVALVADAQLAVSVGAPGVDQAFVSQSQGVSVARHNLRVIRRSNIEFYFKFPLRCGKKP